MRLKKISLGATASILALALAACGGDADNEASKPEAGSSETLAASTNPVADVDTARILNAAATPEDWLSYGGDYEEQRFSRLTQVNRDNVSDLGVAWIYDLAKNRGQEATPIVVNGVMYVTSAWSVVYALDAKTGRELWVHDPEVPGAVAVNACCDVVNRGVAVYGGKVFVGTLDGRLQALDAATGEVIWSEVTVDQSKPYTITGAPRVVKDMVLIGNGGAEYGVRGFISAYNVNTGDLVWRFYTTPNPEKKLDGAASDEIFAKIGNESWGDTGRWVSDGGGGTVWDSIIYDSANNSVIVGVGNGSPWNAEIRDPEGDGDNLFVSSILALDADTGDYKWHFQGTPRDTWDFTATQTLILADLPVSEDGANRRVVMQAPKNGFFYVLDAETGDFISAETFVPINWATGVDEYGRPIENPAARYKEAGFPVMPTPNGAHNWHPMAFSPNTGLAYIPTSETRGYMAPAKEEDMDKRVWNTGTSFLPPGFNVKALLGSTASTGARSGGKGYLLAWDPVKQEAVWKFEHPGTTNGGVLATASDLVFQSSNGGVLGAFDAATGEKLWERNLNQGAVAAPSTYEVDGEQYVAIVSGWGQATRSPTGDKLAPETGRVITFKLGAAGDIPPTAEVVLDETPKAGIVTEDDVVINLGFERFMGLCATCHGLGGASSGVLPDLRWSPITGDADAWKRVVLDGAFSRNGMASFSTYIDEDEAEAIRAYILLEANTVAKIRAAKEAPADN